MANWLYNGVELPELPEWDKETYPYALIEYYGENSSFGATANLYVFDTLTGRKTIQISSSSTMTCIARSDGGTFNSMKARLMSAGEAVSSPGFGSVTNGNRTIITTSDVLWANYDIPDYDNGGTIILATNPIRLDSKLAISLGQMMSYNGTVLPPLLELTEEQKTQYPYLYICGDKTKGIYYLYFSASAKSVFADGASLFISSALAYVLSGGKWKKGYPAYHYPVIWSNTDVYYYDSVETVGGSLYLAASEPVSCVGAVFTCSNLNETDSVYKVASWCYLKGTSYLNASFTYVSESSFAGTYHTESWGLAGLTEGTEYELYACIMVDDVATDHNALVTFTADGTVEELDFTNATLSVETGVVQHNSYAFKLAYTGLPYNADGTSAVFNIVAVTDVGDRAYMDGKITSGSGTVNGTFVDLEPLTDYTATFEVYYNGEPTGVTASVSFTTEEEMPAAGYDRDSFLLGFASGLGCTAATKDGVDYNGWTWGYIVGSALRKAL